MRDFEDSTLWRVSAFERMRQETGGELTLSEFKKLLREQFFMLTLDERRAVEAIPAMLAKDPELASGLASKLRRLITIVGAQTAKSAERWVEVEQLLESAHERPTGSNLEEPQLELVRPLPIRVVRGSKAH